MKRLFRAVYGEPLRHLAVLLPSFAVCGYALVRLLRTDWPAVATWVAGSAILHDLLVVPLYGGADRLLTRAAAGRTPHLVNHLRVPAVLSLLTLLVYWPLITRDAGVNYRRATGLDAGVFLPRWVMLTAVFFALSGILLGVRGRRRPAGRRRSRVRPEPDTSRE